MVLALVDGKQLGTLGGGTMTTLLQPLLLCLPVLKQTLLTMDLV
jgi:hypothetical protein